MHTASGRSVKSNGTILDLVTLTQLIGVIGALLVVLFTLIKPEASNGLNTGFRILFWALHVGLGLATLWGASRWLASIYGLKHRLLSSVLLSGCAAALIAAPGYVFLDLLFAPYLYDLDPEPESTNLLLTMVSEFFDLIPFFLATWLLINLPILLRLIHTPITHINGATENAPTQGNRNTNSESAEQHDSYPGNDTNAYESSPDSASHKTQDKPAFLNKLPGIVGTDIIAISSDLHYLHVWTHDGRATVLGSLKEAATELGNTGMLIHRSHWVANAHVIRITGSANKALCILSNDLQIPISRRRYKDVREFYGHGVVSAQVNDKQS